MGASSYSFVVEFNFFKNNHVSYGYVLGSSAHLEPRTLAAAAFFLSVSCHTGMLSFGYVIFYLGQFLKFPPYVWTIVTSFLITGEGIGIILDTYFLYTYSSQLEIATPRVSGPGDYITYLLFVCSVVLGLNLFVTGGVVFISALILAMCYTCTQDARGQKATFIVVQIPAQFIPYARIRWWYELGTYAKLHQENVAK